MTYRGWTLLWISIMHLGMAWWVLNPASIVPDKAILFELLPIGHRSAAWAAGGLIGLLGVAAPRLSVIGWTAVIIMPVERAIGHLWSWIAHFIPGNPPGDQYGGGITLFWAGLAALILINARREDA